MGFTRREVFNLIKYTAVMMAVQHTCVADHLPPPRNLSYEWIDAFHVHVSWLRPPPGLMDQCEVSYLVTSWDKHQIKHSTFEDIVLTTEEMGSTGFTYTVQTKKCCTSKASCVTGHNRKRLSITRQDQLVTDLTCFLYAKDAMNCSWKPAEQFQDLKVLYRSCDNSESNSDRNLTACEDHYNMATRRGCYLKGILGTSDVCILMEGTYQGRAVRDTFRRTPNDRVKPPPPRLNVTAKGDDLLLSWDHPGVGEEHCWKYHISYTHCNYSTHRSLEKLSAEIPYDECCLYKIQIKASFSRICGGGGETDLSDVVTYRNCPGDPLPVAVIVIPAILSVCVILSCYCFRRHKGIICPIVPDPSVLFKEMMMNRSKEPMSTTGNLYIPVLEIVESCNISPAQEDDPTSAKLSTGTYTDV